MELWLVISILKKITKQEEGGNKVRSITIKADAPPVSQEEAAMLLLRLISGGSPEKYVAHLIELQNQSEQEKNLCQKK